MSDQPIQMSSGIPTTVLPEPDPALRHELGQARQARQADDPREAVSSFVAANPRSLDGWAEHGDLGRDVMDRYAAYRVGYHRGLDALRANGWRGSGYVRWSAPGNQGFLRCLLGLHLMATEIGEDDEAGRCAQFLMQLDPSGVPEEYVEAMRRS
ncbi:MAG: DUF3151 family protein [Ilumatobacteraceae bacterium]|nr:DUF3151 family protein [Ilumatobacteraceae bacterium]